jgi:2-oxoglutarate/2-oxoacid ferredoxin oxidoreductase subunit alpha
MLQFAERVTGLQRVNDFVVKFANVNGSGSASANALFGKAILRMGIPMTPRNIFPSNIQGLPTWYEVRVSEAGHLGARGGGVDLMVAMNPQTWAQDIAEIVPDGYLFYDNTKPMPPSKFRKDIVIIGVPLTEIVNRAYSESRQRQLFKNIVYLGALSALLQMDVTEIEKLLAEQFRGRDKLITANVQALHMGRDWVLANLECPIGLTLRRANAVGDCIFVEGNAAAALGAVYGGATVCAWYPITPSSSLCESLISYMKKYRVDKETGKATFAIVQAEDEIASLGMVIGASWAGARAMTATAGPGISLMSEFAGLAYYAETPAVIFDVQRVGPSTGLPTRTAQGDLLTTAFLSHGDTKHVMIIPSSVEEAYTMSMQAFDLAEQLQTPVFVMMDLDLGMNNWMSDAFTYPDKPINRGKLLTEEVLKRLGTFGRYTDVDGDGIPYRTIPGDGMPAYFARGSGHNAKGQYSERPDDYVDNMDRLSRKFDTARKLVPRPIVEKNPKAKIGFIAFGTSHFATQESRDQLREETSVETSYFRLRGYPFTDELAAFIDTHDRLYVIEQNRDAQLLQLMKLELSPERQLKLRSVLHYNGLPIDARSITDDVLAQEGFEVARKTHVRVSAGSAGGE